MLVTFFHNSTVFRQQKHLSQMHFQAVKVHKRIMDTRWPLKLPTAHFSSFDVLASPAPQLALVMRQDTWTGWEDDGIPPLSEHLQANSLVYNLFSSKSPHWFES